MTFTGLGEASGNFICFAKKLKEKSLLGKNDMINQK